MYGSRFVGLYVAFEIKNFYYGATSQRVQRERDRLIGEEDVCRDARFGLLTLRPTRNSRTVCFSVKVFTTLHILLQSWKCNSAA